MNILYLITKISIGGTEAVVRDLAVLAKKNGHDVTIMTFSSRSNHITEAILKNNINIITFPSRNPFAIANFKFLINTIKDKSYHIIHAHTEEAHFCLSLIRFFVRIPTPIVMTEHYYRYKNSRFNPFRKWMYLSYKKVICVSNEMKHFFHKYSSKIHHRCVVIHNGIDIKKSASQFPIPSNQPIKVICNARLVNQKDIATSIRALAYTTEDIHLTIAGDGKLRKKLTLLITQLNLQDRVTLLGWRDDISALLQTADIYLQSSKWEGCSIAILEAMACGLPLIVSNATGIVETVGAAALVFPVGNEIVLAQHLDALAKNPTLRHDLAKRASARATEFTLEIMWEKYANLYQEVIC